MADAQFAVGERIRRSTRQAGTFAAFTVVAVIGGGANGVALMISLAAALASPVSLGSLRQRARSGWPRPTVPG